jgi:prepilin-type processing-associated H-X9-DG protein
MVTESSYTYISEWNYFSWWGLMPHNKGSNVLFFDGHVAWMPYLSIPKGASTIFWEGGL